MKCETMSDRMPLVASGASAWSESESHHLAECGDCSAEWKIAQAAWRVSRSTPRLDAERISLSVLHRLRTEPVTSRRSRAWWIAGTGVAAATALLGVFLSRSAPPTGTAQSLPGLEIPMSELDSLTQEQLRLVLEAIEEPLETPMTNEAPSMLDLDDQQLERLLRSLEG